MSTDRERLGRMLDVVQATLQDPDPGALERDPASWLAGRNLSEADARALSDLGGRRLLIYRRLVHRGLRGAIRVEIPRTAARLGDLFEAEVTRFFEQEMPRSHYLRDAAFELVEWAAPRWRVDPRVPNYLVDLARHELSAFEVAGAPAGEAPGPTSDDLTLVSIVRFDPAARIRRYDYAVHRLLAELDARDEAEARETWLLAYRDRDHDVRYLELTPTAASILEALMRGDALGDAVKRGAETRGAKLTPELLEGTARLLADLVDRGVVVGTAA